uniref:Coiled-coil domain-containing protein 181 n=1 Tax=Ciona intestinalis TaxID=7719 RepID=F6X3J8_CIOIN
KYEGEMRDSKMEESHEKDWEKDLGWLLKDSDKTEKVIEMFLKFHQQNDENEKENQKEFEKRENTSDGDVITQGIIHVIDYDITGEERTSDAPTTDDDDDDGLTLEGRRELEENTLRNDADEGEEYNVLERLEKANEALKNDSMDESESERERRVIFKPKLVDFEAPPQDYSSSSSSSSDDEENRKVTKTMEDMRLTQQGNETVEINGQKIRKDEKVLIERDGKFELVGASELKAILPPVNGGHPDNVAVVNGNHYNPLPPVKPRPKSAPVRSSKPHPPTSNYRPFSANNAPTTPSSNYTAKVKKILKIYIYIYIYTFCYSPELKELMRKRAAAKAAREREEEARRKAEEESARQEAEYAWKCWLERKNEQIKEQRKRERQVAERRRKDNEKNPNEAAEAYSTWLKDKRKQTKKERIEVQQQQIEIDEGWYIRERAECRKAFRQWLRKKNEAARQAQMQDKLLRRQSLKQAREARRAQKLLESIRESQQMKYVEYYG